MRQNPRVPRVGGVRTVYLRGYRLNKKAEGTRFVNKKAEGTPFDPSMSGFVLSFNNDNNKTTTR